MTDYKTLVDECAPYLKDGETPAQCIQRNRDDVVQTLKMLTESKQREEELEKKVITNTDVMTVAHLFLHEAGKGWAKISSGLFQDFQGGFSSFNVRHDAGTEYRVTFKMEEI